LHHSAIDIQGKPITVHIGHYSQPTVTGKATRWLNKLWRFDSEAGRSVSGIGRDTEKRVEESTRDNKSKQRQERLSKRESRVDGWIGKTQLDGFIQGIQGGFLYKIATFDGGIESKEDKDKQRYKWIKLWVDRGEIKRSWAKSKRERGWENGSCKRAAAKAFGHACRYKGVRIFRQLRMELEGLSQHCDCAWW
jgi:hypothetical protein